MKPIFKFLTGDINWIEHGAKWVSQTLNNGEFDYWLVIDFINMDESCGKDNEGQAKYNTVLSVVSPAQCPETERDRAIQYCGHEIPWEAMQSLQRVEALHAYGIHAVAWNGNGNNATKLIQEAKQEAAMLEALTFRFNMDSPKNRIGTNGWELLRGDIMAGLNRATGQEAELMRKIQGAQSTETLIPQ